MANGEPFGPERGKVWYGLVFKTCSQSFMDSAGETIATWESRGDDVGANHLRKLVQTSKAPLFRWPPFPAPGIAAQGAETLNQLVKKTPKDGTRRLKQTFLQFARGVVSLELDNMYPYQGVFGLTKRVRAYQVANAYRSYSIILESPKLDKASRKNAMKKLQRERKSMSKGKYAVLLACLQQLKFRAFKMVEKMVAEGANHHVLHGKHEVWANYQALSHPDNKYIHLIKETNGKWQCIVKHDDKPCWQNRIKGIICSHIAQYLVQTITAGGQVDLRLIGNSCLPRYRITRAEVVRTPPGTLNTPDYDGLTLAKLSAKDNTAIFALMGLVRDCARRGGTDILELNSSSNLS